MTWHVRLGHLHMSKLQRIAAAGRLPKQLEKCRQPLCQSCMYGMMVKKPWRTKEQPRSIAPNTDAPGQHVSVDQMESPVPGLIGQLKRRLTIARYRFATIFVDTYSRASYVHLQQTSNAIETLEAKKHIKNFSRTNGITNTTMPTTAGSSKLYGKSIRKLWDKQFHSLASGHTTKTGS
jgi:hypothetical protein